MTLERSPPGGALRATSLLRWLGACAALAAAAVLSGGTLRADSPRPERAAAGRGVWPSQEQLVRVLLLRDHNTRVVLAGTSLLGVSAGLVGVFLLLRRRSLTADVISHATLPGIAIAFLVLEACRPSVDRLATLATDSFAGWLGGLLSRILYSGDEKSLPALLLGAFLSGLAGMACVTAIVRGTRIKEDAALAMVLSVFFGLGIALLTIVQQLPSGNVAGLSQFIYGKAASMVTADVQVIAWSSFVVLAVFVLLFKEWLVVSFDDQFALAQGWPVLTLDLLLLALVTSVTVIGLQSVGLLLVVALMIIPATAARCWTFDLQRMTWLSALLGGLSSVLGVLASALFPRLPAGAVIVLAGSLLFLISLLFGARRGVIVRGLARRARDRRIAREHLLRALFECLEPSCPPGADIVDCLTRSGVLHADLLRKRTWTPSRMRKLIQAAEGEGDLVDFGAGGVQLTQRGAAAACRVVRNHRLWELYLLEYTERSPARVDRDADDIEHDLGPDIVARLERVLRQQQPVLRVPPSPHALDSPPHEVVS